MRPRKSKVKINAPKLKWDCVRCACILNFMIVYVELHCVCVLLTRTSLRPCAATIWRATSMGRGNARHDAHIEFVKIKIEIYLQSTFSVSTIFYCTRALHSEVEAESRQRAHVEHEFSKWWKTRRLMGSLAADINNFLAMSNALFSEEAILRHRAV